MQPGFSEAGDSYYYSLENSDQYAFPRESVGTSSRVGS